MILDDKQLMKNISYHSIKKIPGWFHITDFEIFRVLCNHQNAENNAIVEIGTHHGKSFLPLAVFSGSRNLYVVDIFEDQSKNIDKSGLGDEAEFRRNLRKFGIDEERVKVDRRMSSEVAPEDIKEAVGDVSFFHIDGGHHFAAVQSDISLAMSVMASGGVIAIDDVFRPEWPEVSIGAFSHKDFLKDYVPFAIGFNKTYFCERAYRETYQKALLESFILQCFRTKTYMAERESILVFQRYPLPEWGTERFSFWFLSMYFPRVFLNRIVRRLLRVTFRFARLVQNGLVRIWHTVFGPGR